MKKLSDSTLYCRCLSQKNVYSCSICANPVSAYTLLHRAYGKDTEPYDCVKTALNTGAYLMFPYFHN